MRVEIIVFVWLVSVGYTQVGIKPTLSVVFITIYHHSSEDIKNILQTESNEKKNAKNLNITYLQIPFPFRK